MLSTFRSAYPEDDGSPVRPVGVVGSPPLGRTTLLVVIGKPRALPLPIAHPPWAQEPSISLLVLLRPHPLILLHRSLAKMSETH